MDLLQTLLLAAALLGIFLVWRERQAATDPAAANEKQRLIEDRARLESTLEQKNQKLGELEMKLAEVTREKDQLEGRGKQVFVEKTKLEADHKNLINERDALSTRLAKYEEAAARREKEHLDKLNKLENAEKKLTEEQQRTKAIAEAKAAAELAERDRLWAEHENSVLAQLRELTARPELAFRSFDNGNLPDDFDGKLKPDFMLDFLGQYIIFDAKSSRSENLQVYIKDQVKKTVQKVKGNQQIYPTIFLVVPTLAISELKITYFYEEGFTFFVISPDSLAPILAAFKKIAAYEFAEQFDPAERENIVKVLSNFEAFVLSQNAANILLAEKAVEVIGSKQVLSAEIQTAIEQRRAEIKPFKLKDSDMKKLTQSPAELSKKTSQLVSPRASVEQRDLEEAAQLFDA